MTAGTKRVGRSEGAGKSIEPIGLGRADAARFIGLGPATFDRAVSAGTLPAPRTLAGAHIWDVDELRGAFRAIAHERRPPCGADHGPGAPMAHEAENTVFVRRGSAQWHAWEEYERSRTGRGLPVTTSKSGAVG